jgi:glycine hydroxymethyltransferase
MVLTRHEGMGKEINKAVFPRMQGGPLMQTIAAKAVAFGEALQPEFKNYQKGIRANAVILAEVLDAGGVRLVSGGTDNHMVLCDLTPLGISGKDAEESLGRAYITVNRNAIPYDPKPPRVTSGLRLGTPAITSRGFGVEETRKVAESILEVLANVGDESTEKRVQDEVQQLTSRFPVPGRKF